jgi:hypothetical protein
MKTFRVYVRDNALQAFDVQAETKEGATAILQDVLNGDSAEERDATECEFVNLGESEYEIDSVEEIED